MGKQYHLPYEVAYYDTDLTGNMTLERLVAVAILASEKQSKILGRDANYLEAFHLGWIITQYDMEIIRFPTLFEKVSFHTEATTWNKFFCYRRFWVEDELGNLLAEMLATFALMDLTTRKIKTVTPEIIDPFGGEKVNRIQRSEKIPVVSFEKHLPYRVRYFDLDVNQHVNNSKYFSWLLDPLGEDFLKNHHVKKVHIRFDQEVSSGQMIESYLHQEGNVTFHQIKMAENLCTEAKMEWS